MPPAVVNVTLLAPVGMVIIYPHENRPCGVLMLEYVRPMSIMVELVQAVAVFKLGAHEQRAQSHASHHASNAPSKANVRSSVPKSVPFKGPERRLDGAAAAPKAAAAAPKPAAKAAPAHVPTLTASAAPKPAPVQTAKAAAPADDEWETF